MRANLFWPRFSSGESTSLRYSHMHKVRFKPPHRREFSYSPPHGLNAVLRKSAKCLASSNGIWLVMGKAVSGGGIGASRKHPAQQRSVADQATTRGLVLLGRTLAEATDGH